MSFTDVIIEIVIIFRCKIIIQISIFRQHL